MPGRVGPWALLSALLALLLGTRPAAAEEPEEYVYLVVIDHSSSMVNPDPDPVTKKPRPVYWPDMHRRAERFVGIVPDGSLVRVTLFEGGDAGRAGAADRNQSFSIRDDASREAALRYVREIRPPPPGGAGTALHDALLKAFVHAERLAAQRPDRHISIMLYTDGKDEHSVAKAPEVVATWGRLRDRVRDAWLWYTPLAEKRSDLPIPVPIGERVNYGEPKIPLPLRVRELQVGLKSPRASPSQPLRLTLAMSPRVAAVLEGRSATVTFEPDAGSPLSARIEPASLPLTPGPHDLTIAVAGAGALPADREFSGRLRIVYPELPEHFVQGPPSVAVVFDKAAQAGLRNVRPPDGSVYAVGQQVAFSAESRADATIRWEFPDGRVETGPFVARPFMQPGPVKVVVTASSEPSLPPTRAELTLRVVDVGAEIAPPGRVLAGRPTPLRATVRGDGVRVRWEVEDSAWPGDGARGESLTYTFPGAGRYRVRAVAVSPQGEFSSREVTIDVEDAPGVAILSPASGSEIELGAPVELTAAATGRVERVRWRLAVGGREVHAEETPVAERDGRPLAALRHRFDETLGEGEAVVEAGAVPAVEGVEPSRVRLRLVRPKRGVAIVAPAAGSVLRTEAEVAFEAEVSGADATDVLWRVATPTGKVLVERRSPLSGGRARLAHRFAESADLFPDGATAPARVEVTASLVLARATGAEPPSDRRTFDVAMGARAVRAAEPAPGSAYRYGEETTLRADVEGSGIVGVRWDVRTADGSAFARDADVVEDGARRFAVLAVRFDEKATGDRPVTVTATARLAPGVAGAAASATWTLEPPPFSVELRDASGTEGATYALRDPATILLRCSHAVEQATWTADGRPAPGGDVARLAVAFDAPGSHVVAVSVRTLAGRLGEASRTVVVTARPPKPRLVVLDGQDPATTFDLGGRATLRDASEGDVGRREWVVDGIVQPDGVVTSAEPRRVRAKLRVWGPKDVQGVEAGPFESEEVEVVFRESRVLPFLGALLLAGLLAGLLVRWLGANDPRDLRVAVKETPPPGTPLPKDAPPSILVRKRWRRWGKSARLPLSIFFPQATIGGRPVYWKTKDGTVAHLEVAWDPVRRRDRRASLVQRAALFYSGKPQAGPGFDELVGDGTRDARRWNLREPKAEGSAGMDLLCYLLAPAGRRTAGRDRAWLVVLLVALAGFVLFIANWAFWSQP
ncbi:MAG: hypothetical protein IT460_13375 [Planctomycetes bacterium]|nr:hypothetical protein [Planctomycetota bacterium]